MLTMPFRFAASTIVLFALTGSAQPQETPAEPVQTDVFVAGTGGYHTYRIPSVIVTPKGAVIAFAEGRHASAADSGHIDLVARRSTDGGATWSPLQVIGDNGPNAFVNPCPVVDWKTGAIWLLATQNLAEDKEKDILAGTSKAGITVWAIKSADDGLTWSRPTEITASVKKPGWTWYATGPGVGIQASSGRIVIPANHAEAGTAIHRSHLFYTDDGGRSWTLGAIAVPGTNESQVVELAGGALMHNMRNHPPKPENFRVVGISRDGGRSYSSHSEDKVLIEPPAQASILRYRTASAGGHHRILFSNPASSRRERLTVRVSNDEGRTWEHSRVIHEGHAAYSTLTVLPDGTIGVLYERGESSAYERITFARFSMDWLASGK